MDQLQELIAKLAKIDGQLNLLLDAADDLTPETRAEHDKLVAKRAKTVAKIAGLKDRAAREAERVALETEAAAQRAQAERAARAAAGNRRLTTPDVPNGAAAAVPTVPAEPRVIDRTAGFRTPRDFCTAVMRADIDRNIMDDRLRPQFQAAAGSDEGRGISDSTAGFLVPEAFSPDLLTVQPFADPISPYTQRVPMDSPTVRIPARTDKNHTTSVSGGLTVTRRPETVAIGSSQMQFEQVVLQAEGLFGISYATREILTDSPRSFAAILSSGFSDQFVYQLINERLTGTGIGEYLGVLNSPALISITKEQGQAATTLLYENLIKMRARCWGYNRSIWLANLDTIPSLMLANQAVGTGGVPVWQPSARVDAPDILLGRPIIFTEYCQTLGTVGDIGIFNFTQYLEGTLQPMEQESSIHARFTNHESVFKFWTRNAGAPWWRSALTPKNGSNTLSPFVVVQTRA